MSNSIDILLRFTEVSKSYESPDRANPLQVLKNIDLALKTGEAISIVGPSGTGKSTFLNLAGALDIPTTGTIEFAGRDLAAMNETQRAEFRNKEIGFVFQLHHLLPQCTVLENVLLPTIPCGTNKDSSTIAHAKELLSRVGLSDRQTHRPGQLSGGECQRVAFVRALINRPSLLLADEPTGALDHATASILTDLLRELNQEEGVAMILVTHAMDLAEKMDRVLTLESGSFSSDQ